MHTAFDQRDGLRHHANCMGLVANRRTLLSVVHQYRRQLCGVRRSGPRCSSVTPRCPALTGGHLQGHPTGHCHGSPTLPDGVRTPPPPGPDAIRHRQHVGQEPSRLCSRELRRTDIESRHLDGNLFCHSTTYLTAQGTPEPRCIAAPIWSMGPLLCRQRRGLCGLSPGPRRGSAGLALCGETPPATCARCSVHAAAPGQGHPRITRAQTDLPVNRQHPQSLCSVATGRGRNTRRTWRQLAALAKATPGIDTGGGRSQTRPHPSLHLDVGRSLH